MWYSPDVVIHEKYSETTERLIVDESGNQTIDEVQHVTMDPIAKKSTKTTSSRDKKSWCKWSKNPLTQKDLASRAKSLLLDATWCLFPLPTKSMSLQKSRTIVNAHASNN